MHAHIHTYTYHEHIYQYVCDRGTWWIQVAWRGFKITAAVAAAVELLTKVVDHLHCKSFHFKIKKSKKVFKLLLSVADEKACMHTYIHTSTNTY